MSEDNWSLKGKEVKISIEEGEINDIHPIHTPIIFRGFPTKDIKTLHQKLIENIDKRIAKLENVCPYPAGEIIELNLTKKIINYLFGVEEEK